MKDKVKLIMRKIGCINERLIYLLAFVALTAVEVLIALFVHDNFVRPYIGDVLVVIVIYCFVRIFIPKGIRLIPLYIFAFAVIIEIGQYFNYAELLGLGGSRFFRILLGTSFSWYDIICYAAGCLVCAGTEAATLYGLNMQNYRREYVQYDEKNSIMDFDRGYAFCICRMQFIKHTVRQRQ